MRGACRACFNSTPSHRIVQLAVRGGIVDTRVDDSRRRRRSARWVSSIQPRRVPSVVRREASGVLLRTHELSRGCTNCGGTCARLRTSVHPRAPCQQGMYRVIDPADGGSGMMCRKSMSSYSYACIAVANAPDGVARPTAWSVGWSISGFHMDIASRIDRSLGRWIFRKRSR